MINDLKLQNEIRRKHGVDQVNNAEIMRELAGGLIREFRSNAENLSVNDKAQMLTALAAAHEYLPKEQEPDLRIPLLSAG